MRSLGPPRGVPSDVFSRFCDEDDVDITWFHSHESGLYVREERICRITPLALPVGRTKDICSREGSCTLGGDLCLRMSADFFFARKALSLSWVSSGFLCCRSTRQGGPTLISPPNDIEGRTPDPAQILSPESLSCSLPLFSRQTRKSDAERRKEYWSPTF